MLSLLVEEIILTYAPLSLDMIMNSGCLTWYWSCFACNPKFCRWKDWLQKQKISQEGLASKTKIYIQLDTKVKVECKIPNV